MWDRFTVAVRQHALVAPGDRGAVAFSGGGDSLCLLHLMARLAQQWNLALQAVHVDHGLRAGSAYDATCAVELASRVGVEAVVLKETRALPSTGNLQEHARELRYRLLFEHAQRERLRWVAVAHTATDQAETVLMRALRGAGARGLAGMRWVRPLREDAPDGPLLVRPLLEATREEVGDYVAACGLEPILDPSNATPCYLRNRVRATVLPAFVRENPAAVETLARLAANCREEHEALEMLAQRALHECRDADGLRVEDLQRLPRALRLRVLRLAYEELRGRTALLTRRHLERMDGLLASSDGTAGIDLPGLRVERRYGRVVWVEPAAEAPPVFQPVQLVGPGRVVLSNGKVVRITCARVTAAHRASDVLRASAIHFPLLLRPARPGDRIAVGPAQSRKVARVLIDAKVPRDERRALPVLVAGGAVLLLPGIRRAHGLAAAIGDEGIVVAVEGRATEA